MTVSDWIFRRGEIQVSRLPKAFLCLLFLVACSYGDETVERVGGAATLTAHEKVANVGRGGAGAISADGRFLVHGENGDVVLRDIQSGQRRVLAKINNGNARAFAISPDNKTVAFAAYASGCTLRTIDVNGANARDLVADEKVADILSLKWTPDDKFVAAVLVGRNWSFVKPVLINARDGSQTDLELGARVSGSFDFSHDNRYVAFISSANRDNTVAKIMLHDRDTAATKVIVEHPEKCQLLGWTPLGDGLIYLRFRGSSPEVWSQRIKNGEAGGKPEFLETRLSSSYLNTDRLQVIGMTRDGDCYYGGPAWTNDVYLVDIDPKSQAPGTPRRIVEHVGYDSSAHYGKDGKYLSYAFGHGRRMRSMTLGIRNLESGEERRFRLNLRRFGSHAFQPHWSADGKSILTQAWDEGRQQGLFRVDLQTEEVMPSVLATGNEQGSTSLEWPSWSKEGTAFAVRYQDWAPRRIVRLGPNDEQVKVYVSKNPAATLSHLAVSPDAEHVAFVESDFAAGETIVKIVAAKGGLARKLVRLPRATESIYGQAVFALAWMPDSEAILYVPPASDGRQLKLWRVTVKGGKVTSLGGLVDAPQAFGLSVRPDGQQLALTAGTPLHSEAWVLRHIGKKVAP
jgi:Tol biopolymer transport system component